MTTLLDKARAQHLADHRMPYANRCSFIDRPLAAYIEETGAALHAVLAENSELLASVGRMETERDEAFAKVDSLYAHIEAHPDFKAKVAAMERAFKAEHERDAALRELDRWRHGNTIEGDFVCPNELEVARLKSTIEDWQIIETERDAYRSALADLVAATRDNADTQSATYHRGKAIDLLKHGPQALATATKEQT